MMKKADARDGSKNPAFLLAFFRIYGMLKADKGRGDGCMDIYQKIVDRVTQMTPTLVAWRRELHRFP